jgi:nicotinamidase-related amidase
MLAKADESVLLLIDIQERLGAAMPPEAFAQVVANARRLVEGARLMGVPVVFTEQYPRGLGSTAAELAPLLEGAVRVEKTRFSAAPQLPELGRRQVVVVGMEAHVCVLQTALELSALGKQVFVAEDGCCSRAAANSVNAMARMRSAGVVVSNTESILFEWVSDAVQASFKAVSKLVR